jgi:hypothetical protein
MFEDLDLPSITDERTRALVTRLLNLLEDVMTELRAAQAEIQRLRDEINRLKGEQGQPTIKPNTLPPSPKDISSEQERRTPKAWSKGRKTDRIAIDRERVVEVDPACLPPDAVFKGYEDVVVQDVVFRTDNVLFHKPTVCPSHDPANMLSDQELPTSIQVWRGHGQEAKRGEAGGHRITRHVTRLGRFSSRVRPLRCPCLRCGA